MYVLPEKNSNLVDSSVAIYPEDITTHYVNRRYGGAFSFGYVGPGQTSKTIITYLTLSGTAGIKNIKLSISDIGSINFYNNCFAYDVLDYVDDTFLPQKFFGGINSSLDKRSSFNVNIENRNPLSSKYVYLNATLPEDAVLWQGVIKYAWFFDYV